MSSAVVQQMNPVEYVRALRRRWKVIAAAVLVALLGGWITTIGGSSAPVVGPVVSYSATTMLMNMGTVDPGVAPLGVDTGNLNALSTLTTAGEVPIRVAKKVDTAAAALELASKVEAIPTTESGLLQITATSDRPEEAEVLANTFAQELIGWLGDRREELASSAAKALQARLDELNEEIAELEGELALAPDDAIVKGSLEAKGTQNGLLSQQYQELVAAGSSPVGLQILQEASAQPVVDQKSSRSAIGAPESPAIRIGLIGLLGLFAGVALALVLDRFDTRVRTRRDAEEHFGLPVLGEVPFVRSSGERAEIATSRSNSRSADAYRLLSAGIELSAGPHPTNGKDGGTGANDARTILVTSPDHGDGKTLVVANLAAVFAEMGKRTVVLSCDFRRPALHDVLHISNQKGLSTAVQSSNGTPVLEGYVLKYPLGDAHMWVVPSGPTPEKPGALLASDAMQSALDEARMNADVVLLDSSPLLASSDATLLVPRVDGVLVVARAGRTSAEQAKRTSEIIQQLRAPATGVVLNCSKEVVVSDNRSIIPFLKNQIRGFPHLARHSTSK